MIPFCVARLLQVALAATAELPLIEDFLDEDQFLLLLFLHADLGVVLCLMMMWGAQVLSNWWAESLCPL